MLLRRYIEHVREQNWLAVAIDFLIVVLGVYIGLQTQEWSAQRDVDALEVQYMTELKEEMSRNTILTSGTVEAMRTVVASGKRAGEFMRSDGQCEQNCWRLLVDFFIASQVITPAYATTVYDETQRLGFPRSANVSSAIDQYYTLLVTSALGMDNNPKYRVSLRELLTVEAHEQLWSNCHKLRGSVETVVVDCPPGLPTEAVKAILQRIHARREIVEQLNYWIGMHSLWIPYLSHIPTLAQEAIEDVTEWSLERS